MSETDDGGSIGQSIWDKKWILLGIVVLFAIPDIITTIQELGLPYSDQIRLDIVMIGLTFGMAAVGLNLLLRHTKLVSFGHAAFFGTGGYAVALLASYQSERLLGDPNLQSAFVLLAGAVVAAAVVAAIIGALSLRHTGLYFSLITLAFGQLLFAIVNNHNDLLGGSDGLVVRPNREKVALFGSTFGDNWEIIMFYFLAVLIVLSLYVMYRIINSPYGSALDAIGQDRTRAQFIGIPVKRYVWTAFIVSGIYGGLFGGMYAILQRHMRPEATLDVFVSGDILFMAILGGFGTLTGPLVGGVVLEVLLFAGEDIVGAAWDQLMVGVILLVIVYGFPQGIVGSISQGGRVREGAGQLIDDPAATLGEWSTRAVNGTKAAGKRSAENLKVLFLGVE